MVVDGDEDTRQHRARRRRALMQYELQTTREMLRETKAMLDVELLGAADDAVPPPPPRPAPSSTAESKFLKLVHHMQGAARIAPPPRDRRPIN